MQKISVIFALCLISACTQAGPGSDQNSIASDNLSSANLSDAVATIPADAPDSHAKPKPGALGVFKDWTVGCDNIGGCMAVALSPEDGDFAQTLMSISRAPGNDGAITVRITGQKIPATPVTVSIDGNPVAKGGVASDGHVTFTAADAHTIAREASSGNSLSLTGAKGLEATISLSGLSAALRYMDAEQGLAGTRTALVAKGNSTASVKVPKLPVIRAAALSNDDPTKLDDARIDTLRKANGCEIANFMSDPPQAGYAPLGGGKTLMLLPCDSGAYNLMSLPLIVLQDGSTSIAKFDAPTGMGDDDKTVELVNAAYDGRTLNTFSKARGLGDCGIIQDFVWDGSQFRLSKQSEMGECRGSTDYITTWRAAVLR